MPWKRHVFLFFVGIDFSFISQTAPVLDFFRCEISILVLVLGFYWKSNRRGVKERPQDMVENSG